MSRRGILSNKLFVTVEVPFDDAWGDLSADEQEEFVTGNIDMIDTDALIAELEGRGYVLKKKEKMTMSKTFGNLRAGDEVYVIKGNSVEIVKVSVAATRSNSADTLLRMSGCVFHVPAVHVQFYNEVIGDIYCDIDDAIKAMKEICENALRDYERASGALIKLETKNKENDKRGSKQDNNV